MLKKTIVFFSVICILMSGFTNFRLLVNADEFDQLNIDYYNCGDTTFFHSDYISDTNNHYRNCSYVNNGAKHGYNSLVFNRCGEENRYNPQRKDSSIYMMDNSQYDVHFDVNKITPYPYYFIRSRAKTDNMGGVVRLCYIRYSDGKNYDVNLLELAPDGNIKTGNTVLASVREGEWFSYIVAIDMENHSADIYVNDEYKTTVSFSQSLKTLTLARFWLYHDADHDGDIYFDELEVTGMHKPYKGDDSNFSSIFHNEEPIKQYLSDKIAFHGYSGAMYSDGTKTYPEFEFDGEKSEIYTNCKTINKALGINLVEYKEYFKGSGITIYKSTGYAEFGDIKIKVSLLDKNGKYLIPLKPLAKKLLEKNVFDDGKGMIIVSDTPVKLNLSAETDEFVKPHNLVYQYTDILALNRFLAFERPSASQIKADFEAANPAHPRIMANKAQFDILRDEFYRSGSYLSATFSNVIKVATKYLTTAPQEYNIPDKQRILVISRELVKRMEYLGMAYQLTGDKAYAECAWENLSKTIEFPDWNPSHMIDVGELNAAFAIGYDWMYDGFTPEQRKAIYEGVKRHGLDVTRLCYYGRVPKWSQWANYTGAFTSWKSNFNAVINGGALAAAIAFAEQDPDYCFDIAEKAIRSLEYTMIGFAPEGTWIEGVNYWNYTFSYLSKGIGSLHSAIGTDYGLMKASGTKKTGMWFRSMISPLGGNNYHDASKIKTVTESMLWLGRFYGNNDLLTMRRAAIGSGVGTVYDLLWYKSGISTSEEGLPLFVYSKGIESVSDRSTYTGSNGMYFSAHGGSVVCYHSQCDTGSFVYEANGVRWADDLGAESYDVQRDGGLGFYGSYRRRGEAHNIVVINPNTSDKDGGQNNDAFVPLVSARETSFGSFSQYDMHDAYRDFTSFYTRTFHTDRNTKSLVVNDYINLTDSADICWFMTTPASVSWESDTDFVLTHSGRKLYGKAEVMGNVSGFSGSTTACAPLLGAPVLEGQNENNGYSRILFRATGEGNVLIRVTLSPDKSFSAKNINADKNYIADDIFVLNNGEDLSEEIMPGEISAVSSVYCYDGQSVDATLIGAYYTPDGKLESVKLSEDMKVTLPITVQGGTLKAFVWDMKNLRPLKN